jgi:signal transduction histidine kinase
MNGPDAFGGERPGGRFALPGSGTRTAAAGNGADAGAAAGEAAAGPAAQPGTGRAGRAGHAAPSGRRAKQGGDQAMADDRPVRLALSNWPVSARLGAVFVLASVLGLVFGSVKVSDAIDTANADARTAQLTTLGEQELTLAQALENERDLSAGITAYNVLVSDAAAAKAGKSVQLAISGDLSREQTELTAAYQTTDAAAKRTRALAAAIGPAFPSSIQAKAQNVVAMIDSIPGLRTQLVDQSTAQVGSYYSQSVSELFVLEDEMTSGSGDAALADETRALGALSRAKDEVSQQRAILYGTLIEASVNDAGGARPFNNVSGQDALNDSGGPGALTTAQGLEFAYITDFLDAATPDEGTLYQQTVVGTPDEGMQLLGGFVSLGADPRLIFQSEGNSTSLGINRDTVADTWYTDATGVMGQLRGVEAQVAANIVARSQSLQHAAMRTAIVTSAVTGAAVLLVLLATALMARSLVRPLRRLQSDALEIATVRLPARVAAAAEGRESSDAPATVEPIGVRSTDEIGRVARAFDQVHAEAVRLARTEAQLRNNLNAMFISLSRRSVPLIDRLARMVDSMEQNEDDPDQLANLFSMDHLVTRMRRNSENLLVLAGEEPVRKWTEPVPLTDVARAAAAEIEQYNRVTLSVQPGLMVSGQAAADVVHLLAELIENATLFSPRDTQVRVTVMEVASGGVLVEVRDDGVGVSLTRLADMNWRLDHPPMIDVSISRHMGLFAVSRLAARHGIRVKLRPGTPQGLSALVWLPGTLIGHGAPTADSRSRTLGGDGTGSWATMAGRPGAGRHRTSLLASSGDQPLLARRGVPSPRSTTGWFAAKRPSGRGADAPAEATAGWRPAANGWAAEVTAALPAGGPGNALAAGPGRGPGTAPSGEFATGPAGPLAGVPEQAALTATGLTATGLTATGLPRRVPGMNAHPGQDTPGSGMFAVAADAGTPVLGAPPGGTGGAWGTPARQEGPYQEQVPPRRRSPEAVRSRLSGFQLGSRDAIAQEENSR